MAKQFEIESDIIQDRVRKTREQNRTKEQSRREMPAAAGPQEPVHPEVSSSQEPATRRLLAQDQILRPSEEELLGFVLRYGRSPLQFETDSEFYDPEGSQTVAEFIDAALAADDIHFANLAYEATYNAYFNLYDQGMEQDAIVLALLNGEDRTVASTTSPTPLQPRIPGW